MVSALTMLFTTSAVLPYSNFNLVGEITASAEETESQETNVASVTIDGAVIGYLGERDFEGIDSAFFNKDYLGATITLLDDIAPTSDDTSGKACSILVH